MATRREVEKVLAIRTSVGLLKDQLDQLKAFLTKEVDTLEDFVATNDTIIREVERNVSDFSRSELVIAVDRVKAVRDAL